MSGLFATCSKGRSTTDDVPDDGLRTRPSRARVALSLMAVAVAALIARVVMGPSGTGGPPIATDGWSADYESGSFRQWTSWSVGTPNKGTQYVADVTSERSSYADAPALAHSGNYIAHFEVTPQQAAAGQIHSKVYQQWSVAAPETGWTTDQGTVMPRLPNGSPDGSYSSWYYLPTDYSAASDWANIFQFKRSYLDGGGWHQDPQWWVNLVPAGTFGGVPAGATKGTSRCSSSIAGEGTGPARRPRPSFHR